MINSNYLFNKSDIINYQDLILEQLDIYTQSTFQELQQERFDDGMEYHICMIQEGNRTYFIDASSFIENCIFKDTIIENPLTRTSISSFSILVSSKEAPGFKKFMSKEDVTTPPNHLPILWNDTRRKLADRWDFLLEYGKFFEAQDPEKTIQAYEQAAQMGSPEAKLRLVTLYRSTNQKKDALDYIKNVLMHHADELELTDLFYCAHTAEDCSDPATAFKAYEFAARRGNMIAICEVILQLEVAREGQSNISADWKSKLPIQWQKEETSLFLDHLFQINYGYKDQNYPASVPNPDPSRALLQ